jgi:hypothetical protein
MIILVHQAPSFTNNLESAENGYTEALTRAEGNIFTQRDLSRANGWKLKDIKSRSSQFSVNSVRPYGRLGARKIDACYWKIGSLPLKIMQYMLAAYAP